MNTNYAGSSFEEGDDIFYWANNKVYFDNKEMLIAAMIVFFTIVSSYRIASYISLIG